jgi:hypothetical protein
MTRLAVRPRRPVLRASAGTLPERGQGVLIDRLSAFLADPALDPDRAEGRPLAAEGSVAKVQDRAFALGEEGGGGAPGCGVDREWRGRGVIERGHRGVVGGGGGEPIVGARGVRVRTLRDWR